MRGNSTMKVACCCLVTRAGRTWLSLGAPLALLHPTQGWRSLSKWSPWTFERKVGGEYDRLSVEQSGAGWGHSFPCASPSAGGTLKEHSMKDHSSVCSHKSQELCQLKESRSDFQRKEKFKILLGPFVWLKTTDLSGAVDLRTQETKLEAGLLYFS